MEEAEFVESIRQVQQEPYRVRRIERQIRQLTAEKAHTQGIKEAGDVMHLSQNVVEIFIDRIEVFNDESVKIRFTFEDVLKNYEA